jgi:hypothetical protein
MEESGMLGPEVGDNNCLRIISKLAQTIRRHMQNIPSYHDDTVKLLNTTYVGTESKTEGKICACVSMSVC